MSLLVALLAREETGEGEHIDVSMYAASNVTTEMATLRLAGLRVGGPAPDRSPRRADADAAGAGPLPGRSLRHDRCAAARRRRSSPACSALLDRLGLRDEFPSSVDPPARRRARAAELRRHRDRSARRRDLHLGARGRVVPGRAPRRRATSSSRRSASGWPRAPSTRRARRSPTRTSSRAASRSRSSTPSCSGRSPTRGRRTASRRPRGLPAGPPSSTSTDRVEPAPIWAGFVSGRGSSRNPIQIPPRSRRQHVVRSR